MYGIRPTDPGREIDWNRTSEDYGTWRPGFPASFERWLKERRLGIGGQRVVDLGTGTGVLARAFARLGGRVTGLDRAPGQIEQARALARAEGVEVDFRVAEAEETGLEAASAQVVSAAQCWLYFDERRAIAEVVRLLEPGGRLLICHLCWLPREDAIARASEELVLAHNPAWTAADWSGEVPEFPEWAREDFELVEHLVYDEPLPFTRESWRGRIRACRGVGAALELEAVQAFDEEHAALLERIAPAEFGVLHRIDGLVLRPR